MIKDARKEYRWYLTKGDIRVGNQNKVIDEAKEAVAAAEEYCEEKSIKECQKFIRFLEKHGEYKLPKIRVVLAGSFDRLDDLDKNQKVKDSISALSNRKPEIREKAEEYVMAVFDSRVMEDEFKIGILKQLINALQNADSVLLKAGLVRIMKRIAEPKEGFPAGMKEMMIDPLLKSLADDDKTVRADAAEALGDYLFSDISVDAKLKAFDPLLEKTGDSDSKVKLNALKALARLSHPGVEGLVPAGAVSFKEIPADKLTKLANKMISDLDAGFLEYRIMAYGMLSRLISSKLPLKTKDSFAHYFLQALQKDPNHNVRFGAVMALLDIAKLPVTVKTKTKMIPVMIKALQDSYATMVSGWAAYTLEALASSKIPVEFKAGMIDPLARLLDQKYQGKGLIIRVFSALAKSDLHPGSKEKLVPYLIAALKDDNRMTQNYAIAGLKWLMLGLTDEELKNRIGRELKPFRAKEELRQ